jgi:hypothetical protein
MVENTSQRPNELHFLGMLAGSDEYITGMEKSGQAQLVNSEVLPVDMKPSRAEFETLGFVFGEPVQGDDLFISATLPAGWKRRASDHDMWSYIDDETGKPRVAIFYKAAFYDRHAFMRLERDAA